MECVTGRALLGPTITSQMDSLRLRYAMVMLGSSEAAPVGQTAPRAALLASAVKSSAQSDSTWETEAARTQSYLPCCCHSACCSNFHL